MIKQNAFEDIIQEEEVITKIQAPQQMVNQSLKQTKKQIIKPYNPKLAFYEPLNINSLDSSDSITINIPEKIKTEIKKIQSVVNEINKKRSEYNKKLNLLSLNLKITIQKSKIIPCKIFYKTCINPDCKAEFTTQLQATKYCNKCKKLKLKLKLNPKTKQIICKKCKQQFEVLAKYRMRKYCDICKEIKQ